MLFRSRRRVPVETMRAVDQANLLALSPNPRRAHFANPTHARASAVVQRRIEALDCAPLVTDCRLSTSTDVHRAPEGHAWATIAPTTPRAEVTGYPVVAECLLTTIQANQTEQVISLDQEDWIGTADVLC